ncbi:DoxX family protein [Roseobacter sp. EG26]|uniref:DoxX family protein n=1 Tax=Roseobacter sp. EG26 TaxID=3412477 RepID=UPI003CE4DEE8
MTFPENIWPVIGRSMMGGLFVIGGLQKMLDPGPVMQLLADQGMAEDLIVPAALLNLCAGACVIFNWYLRPTCFLLAAYCGFTSLFHLVPTDGWQMSIFVKNWAIVGGFLCLSALGSRSKSLDPDENGKT